MYELIKKILDEAKENNVDIGVAHDYVADELGHTPKLKQAFTVLRRHYEAITELRAKGKNTDIKVICDMEENGNTDGAKNYIKQLKSDGILEE